MSSRLFGYPAEPARWFGYAWIASAERAGLMAGDEIRRRWQPCTARLDFSESSSMKADAPLELKILRNGQHG